MATVPPSGEGHSQQPGRACQDMASTPERLMENMYARADCEKIENERSMPHPDEVLLMSDQYKQPGLCNYYCASQCPIGWQYVPEIKIKELSQIVLEMLVSLNSMNKQKERLIEITADGQITEDELADFIHIQEEQERISITVEPSSSGAKRCWIMELLILSSIMPTGRGTKTAVNASFLQK